MTISAVGSVAQGAGATTLSVNPTATGDCWAFSVATTAAPSSISVSGGGVTTWTAGTSYLDTTNNCYVSGWIGPVTSTGASTITVSGIGAGGTAMAAQQFHTTLASPSWSVSSASHSPGDSGTPIGSGLNITYPSLSAAGGGDSCYWGHCFSIFGSMSAGATSGYTYSVAGVASRQVVFNPTFSGTGSPTATQDNAGAYDAVAMIINAQAGGTTVSGAVSALALAAPAGTTTQPGVGGLVSALALAAPAGTVTTAGAATIPGAVAALTFTAIPGNPVIITGGQRTPDDSRSSYRRTLIW